MTADIRARRRQRHFDQEQEWAIWRDGCEGGESVARYHFWILVGSRYKRTLIGTCRSDQLNRLLSG